MSINNAYDQVMASLARKALKEVIQEEEVKEKFKKQFRKTLDKPLDIDSIVDKAIKQAVIDALNWNTKTMASIRRVISEAVVEVVEEKMGKK